MSNELEDKQLAISKLPESEVGTPFTSAADFAEVKLHERAASPPLPDLEKTGDAGNGYITPVPSTLFDMRPYTVADPAQERRVKVHVKKTEYERRLPSKHRKARATKERKPRATIADRFAEYHASNPHVYKMLVALALADRRQGMKSSGMQMYIEQVRFRMRRKTATKEPFKISNDFAAHYARLIMTNELELADFFVVRELKTK